jgi:hypothetical protein
MTTKTFVYGEKKALIRAMIKKNPDMSNNDIAEHIGCHPVYVGEVRRKRRKPKRAAPVAAPVVETVAETVMETVAETVMEPTVEYTAPSQDVDDVLDQRGVRYGNFFELALITQRLKRVAYSFCEYKGQRLSQDQKEALDMIFSKIGRILNGDPNHVDSWIDIAGYAKLVADRLEGEIR